MRKPSRHEYRQACTAQAIADANGGAGYAGKAVVEALARRDIEPVFGGIEEVQGERTLMTPTPNCKRLSLLGA